MTHAVIIGNGVTGISAARRLRELQPDWTITVISGESTHHYSRPALMYIFMGHMKYQDTKPFEDELWPRSEVWRRAGVPVFEPGENRRDAGERSPHPRRPIANDGQAEAEVLPGAERQAVDLRGETSMDMPDQRYACKFEHRFFVPAHAPRGAAGENQAENAHAGSGDRCG